MTIAKSLPQYEIIPGTKSKRLINTVEAYSDVLKQWLKVTPGFILDEESTPWRGENPLAGFWHDYFSRMNCCPVVTKITAAKIYLEFQYYEDSLVSRKWYTKAHDWLWRGLKAGFVAVCPDFVYWHKYKVEATYEEMG